MTHRTSARARRLAAAGATLALIGASVVGGAVLSASAEVPVVSLSGGPVIYEEGTAFDLGLAGSVTDADTLDYRIVVSLIDSSETVDCTATVTGSDYTNDTAAWACNDPYADLPYGAYQLVATAYDPADLAVPLGSSAPVTLVVFENAPGAVDSQTTNREYPDFTGSGPRMGTVAVEDESGEEVCRADVPADDTGWTCASTVPFTVDDYQVYPHTWLADGTDLGRGTPASLEVTAPVVTITSPSEGSVMFGPSVMIEGTSDVEYSEVQVQVTGGGDSCTGWVYGGTWYCYLYFEESSESVEIVATDASGTSTDTVTAKVLVPPTLTTTYGSTLVVDTVDNIQLDGSGYPGADIAGGFEIGEGYTATCSTVVLPDGTWTCTLDLGGTSLTQDTSYPLSLNQATEWSGGAQSYPANYTLTVDTSHTVIDPALDGALVTSPTILAHGSTELPDDTQLTVRLGYANWSYSYDDLTCSAVVSGGQWECTLDPGEYPLHTDHNALLTVETADDEVVRDGVYLDILQPVEIDGLDGEDQLFANYNPVGISGYGAPSGSGPDEANAITVSVNSSSSETVAECETQTYPAEGEGAGGGWDCYFDNQNLPSGTYTVTVTQAPWWTTETSTRVVTLVVDLEANGRGAVDCHPFPGGFSLDRATGAEVSLWAVADSGEYEGYYPGNPGTCGGFEGDGLPYQYQSYTPLGDCSATTAPDPVLAADGDGCIVQGLTPGRYDLRYGADQDYTWDWFFTVPQAPTLKIAVASPVPGWAYFDGAATPGAHVTVLTTDGLPVCEADADDAGEWSCSASRANTTNYYEAVITDPASGIMSPPSAALPTPDPLAIGPGAPEAPGLFGSTTKVITEGETFTMSGPKTRGGTITVTLYSGGERVGDFTPCALTIPGDLESWECDYSSAALPPGTYELSITQTVDGVTSSELVPRPVLIINAAPVLPTTGPSATPTPVPTPSATPTRIPLTWTLTMTGVNGPLRPGQTVGLSSSGIPAGSEVIAELHSTPIELGTTIVKPDGTFSFTVKIPKNVEPGDHHIVVSVVPPGEEPSIVESPVEIQLDDEAPAPQAVVADDPPASPHDETTRNDQESPTALTGSVPTLFDIITNPVALGIAAGLALIIMLLVAIPAEVLNATIESNTDRFGGFFGRIQLALNRATEWFIGVTRTPIIASALLILLTSIIFGFVDPHFGIDLASLRLVLSVGTALFIVTFVASRITGAIVGRAWKLESSIGMQPAALLFAVLGVVIARVLDFSPGFLVGLVIGLELSHRATELQRIRAIVIEFSVITGLGLLAWLGYSLVVAAQGDAPLDFVTGYVQDTLVAVTSEGLTAVVIALIPVAFLDGKKIWERSKRLWVLIFAIVATAFSLLVLPTALAGQEIADVGWWVLVLVGFAVVTVGVTVWLRATSKSGASEEPAAKVDA
ncbi:hypothetical protein BH09ACT5_BH09ACT5_02230 [soil metagenome]